MSSVLTYGEASLCVLIKNKQSRKWGMSLTNYSKIKPVLLVFILSCAFSLEVFAKPDNVPKKECARALTSTEQENVYTDLFLKAVEDGDVYGVDFLMRAYSVDGSSVNTEEVLKHAARSGHTGMVELLIQLY